MFNKKEKLIETDEYTKILDKMIELEKKKKKTDPVKIAMCIFCTLGGLIFVGMLCYSILKSKVSLDSILSTLLAFFSIFIAIFFYFKADETSTRFYESSYKFMKDISVTLGKIEERFGEKLNNLNEKISHLDDNKDHYNQKIKNIETDKDAMINEIISKTSLSEKEKEEFKQQIKEKDAEIEKLRMEKFNTEKEADLLRMGFGITEEPKTRIPISIKTLHDLMNHDTEHLTVREMNMAIKMGLIDNKGNINDKLVHSMLWDLI